MHLAVVLDAFPRRVIGWAREPTLKARKRAIITETNWMIPVNGSAMRAAFLFIVMFPLPTFVTAQSAGNQPVHYQAVYTRIYADDVEAGKTGNIGRGLQLIRGAGVTTDPTLVIGGKASIHMPPNSEVITNSTTVNMAGNTVYIVDFRYRILNRGSAANILTFLMLPVGAVNLSQGVEVPGMLKNAEQSGTFSTGALTAKDASWYFSIITSADSEVVIDNISVFRGQTIQFTTPPASFVNLTAAPFPRLGKCMFWTPSQVAQLAPGEGVPYLYTQQQVEDRLAFNDVVTCLYAHNQSVYPASLRRLRQLNPGIVMAPYRDSEEQGAWSPNPPPPTNDQTFMPDYEFTKQVAEAWYGRDSKGNFLIQPAWKSYLMNLSDDCPVVNGQTFLTSLAAWYQQMIFPSGQWDSTYFDILFAGIQGYMAYSNDPAVWDFDWALSGVLDNKTKAQTTEMIRAAMQGFLKNLRNQIGGEELLTGNAGPFPELSLAPYLNGYLSECVNNNWSAGKSQAGWRNYFDTYRALQAATVVPRINIVEGCGGVLVNAPHATPSAAELQDHRLSMGTALLDDGFYTFDLYNSLNAPLWMDEYSVDGTGTAVEDRSKKGYLGRALGDAVELASPVIGVLQTNFNTGIPGSFKYDPTQVSAQNGWMVMTNTNHAQPVYTIVSIDSSHLPLSPGKTYFVSFDWRIVTTLDAGMFIGAGTDSFRLPGTVTGDSGTAQFPLTPPASGSWAFTWALDGAGQVAINNVKVSDGGFGPWRRDFENGFVLVNPLLQSHTFSASELAGALNRTGIHRIKGTQAPDINNGQTATQGITLNPFDAIILLADHIDAPPPPPSKPTIKPGGVISSGSFGGSSSISPGSWIEIYGSNLSATARGWSSADFSGPNAPTSLDHVQVTIGGNAAFVDYVSPGQVNALVPSNVPAGPAQLVISGPTGTSDPYMIAVETVEPGLWAPPSFQVNGNQYVGALASDAKTFLLPAGAIPGVTSRPAKTGETIALYGIGFGAVTPNINAGTLVSQSNSLVNALEIRFGNTPAKVVYKGLAPDATGLYQFNVVVPNVPDNPAMPLTFSLAGAIPAQTLYIAVQH
ncbi:MAG TPA: putative glycoside hydrolase [Bryobacteraceae bacterium]|nr:putative glycoside hydrolase [Bryobacteraceae bacterium]